MDSIRAKWKSKKRSYCDVKERKAQYLEHMRVRASESDYSMKNIRQLIGRF